MPRLTITIPNDMGSYLEDLVEDDDQPVIDSKSGAVRACIETHRDGEGPDEDVVREYEERIEELEQEIDRLNRERRQLLEQREENQELVKFAEEQRGLVSEQRDRQNAPVWRRAKWWVFGGGQDQGHGQ